MRCRPGASAKVAWTLFAVGEAAAVAYPFVTSHHHVLASIWYLVVTAVGLALPVVGALRDRARPRLLWLALAGGVSLFFGGDLLWTLDDLVFHIAPFPSAADALYLAAYPVLAVALLAMLRRSQPGGDTGAFLDAVLVATGVGVLTGVLVLIPALSDDSVSVLSRAIATAYPLGDLVLLVVIGQLIVTMRRPTVAGWALCCAQLAILGSDAIYNGLVVAGQAGDPTPWLDVGWLNVYLLTGLAALHPSAEDLTTVTSGRTERLTRLRLVLFGVAALLGPGALLGQELRGADGHPLFVACGSIVLFLLVLGRIATLLHQLQQQSSVLEAMARSDELTSLPNRRTWEHELIRMRETALEHRQPLAIVLLDLDGFKKYNDTRGHLAGDRLLRELATV